MGCDYLAYAVIDAVVDHYFIILETFGEKIELLEEELISNARPQTLQAVHNMKREMMLFRKQVSPCYHIHSLDVHSTCLRHEL